MSIPTNIIYHEAGHAVAKAPAERGRRLEQADGGHG
jgi:hypothetical protein